MARAPVDAPEWLGFLRPGWVGLVIFFWAVQAPGRIGLVGAWLLGFFADVVYADPLGLNGLVLVVVAYVARRLHGGRRVNAVMQQAVLVAAMVLVGEVARRIAHGQFPQLLMASLLPAATSLVVWPFLQLFLGNLARRFRVQ